MKPNKDKCLEGIKEGHHYEEIDWKVQQFATASSLIILYFAYTSSVKEIVPFMLLIGFILALFGIVAILIVNHKRMIAFDEAEKAGNKNNLKKRNFAVGPWLGIIINLIALIYYIIGSWMIYDVGWFLVCLSVACLTILLTIIFGICYGRKVTNKNLKKSTSPFKP